LSTADEQGADRNVLGTEGPTASKRLGFFADKISSSLSGGSSGANLRGPGIPSQHLHPHSHTRTDSASATPPSVSPSPSIMNASSSTINLPKTHTSPSKVRRSDLPYIYLLNICRAHTGAPMTQSLSVVKCTGLRPNSPPRLPCPSCLREAYPKSVL
jgi:hypothetical protein